MDYITEKFSKLGCDNAPGQETLQTVSYTHLTLPTILRV